MLFTSSVLRTLLAVAYVTKANAGACYDFRTDSCSCDNIRCDPELCENGLGLQWSEDCPIECEANCDPLRAQDDDPSCTGPPEMIDRFGKRMYRRKLIARDIPADSYESGTFCALTFELCEGESSITHKLDAGQSDYYRIAATQELTEWKGTKDYQYAGMHDPTGGRSYSPTNPLDAQNLQFIIKVERSNTDENNCVAGVNCLFGLSELACEAPVGSDFLLSNIHDIGEFAGPDWGHTMVSTIDPSPGAGPYTINFIGQGVALTELNVVALSEMMKPFASDGSFSTVKEINYLWANSYWAGSEWIWNMLNPPDLARQFKLEMGKYGIRFNLMHAISREERPEAGFPRIDTEVIGDAFNLVQGDQDPNIKWLVVGGSSFKRSIYPQIVEWGFDMYPVPGLEAKGYPYIGPNALSVNVPAGGDINTRPRSPIFEAYE